MIHAIRWAPLLAAFMGATGTWADEASFQLKVGRGRDLVMSRCSICHSIDYIPMNAPFPDRKLWETEVNKMIKAFGAPITPEEVAPIVDYLTQQYGRP